MISVLTIKIAILKNNTVWAESYCGANAGLNVKTIFDSFVLVKSVPLFLGVRVIDSSLIMSIPQIHPERKRSFSKWLDSKLSFVQGE